MAEDFIAKLTGIARARHHQGRAGRSAQTRDGKPEPAKLGHRGLRRRSPDDPAEKLTRVRALNGDVVQLVGRGAHQHLQPQLFRLIAQPDAAVIVAADPAEIVLAQPEQRPVIDHAAVFIAHGGIDDLPLRQLFHVAGQAVLHQGLGIRPGHLPLAQGRKVDHGNLLAAGPVFGNRALAVGLGQPVSLVFHHVARQRRGAGMKTGFLAHLRLRIGGGTPGNSAREFFFVRIGPDMNVSRVPAVASGRVIRAGRGHADQVGQGPHQHIVTGARPGFVTAQHAMGIDEGVVEEVHSHPAGARFYPGATQRVVEVVRTVHMARIADIVVIFGRTSHRKSVMTADRVLIHFDQRFKVLIEVFRMQARHGIGMPHEAA